MEKIVWSEKDYSVGIPSMDAQHKRLVELLVHAQELAANGAKSHDLDPIFDQIFDYTKYHFLHEEQLLRQAGYSDFETHRMEHNSFTKKILKLHEVYLEDKRDTDVSGTMLVSMLSVWLKHHIQKEDRKYVATLQAKGIV